MSDSLARVPCTIVTGFLGAGKTTLIRHVIANAQGRRLAVIVNEFGDVGIDGEILKGCGNTACPEENIVELANGSWSYIFGGLDLAAASALIDGAKLLAGAADGIMPWRGRPGPLKRGLIARVPPLDFAEEDQP